MKCPTLAVGSAYQTCYEPAVGGEPGRGRRCLIVMEGLEDSTCQREDGKCSSVENQIQVTRSPGQEEGRGDSGSEMRRKRLSNEFRSFGLGDR